MIQRFEKGYLDLSKQHTIVAYMADGTISFSGYIDTSEETMDGVNVTFPSGSKIKCVALYEGSYTADTLPPYVPKGYAAELAQCKRYYNIIPYDMDDYYVNANTAYPSMYPVFFSEMRIVPTVTLQESWNVGSAGVSIDFITKNSLAFQAAATSSRVAWHGKIKLSADL